VGDFEVFFYIIIIGVVFFEVGLDYCGIDEYINFIGSYVDSVNYGGWFAFFFFFVFFFFFFFFFFF